jgi:hypothetical protein
VTAAIIVLFANAVFNAVVWPPFYRRIAKDPRSRDASGRATRFLMVHIFLISGGLVLALASLIAAIALLRSGA